ncbi:hypothetical protein BC936DRAFT_147361 [Jimgerdemannia flammicorona]|uniref:Uncharacterized protein n=1 Tax=Jimgerdemannia flammicorona TaxID=994334 RepID=A0A433D5H0_9FUNG|nr:hypothetical protein BC936DRAFT_147361 [Jimgerdemannia flammicorona]
MDDRVLCFTRLLTIASSNNPPHQPETVIPLDLPAHILQRSPSRRRLFESGLPSRSSTGFVQDNINHDESSSRDAGFGGSPKLDAGRSRDTGGCRGLADLESVGGGRSSGSTGSGDMSTVNRIGVGEMAMDKEGSEVSRRMTESLLFQDAQAFLHEWRLWKRPKIDPDEHHEQSASHVMIEDGHSTVLFTLSAIIELTMGHGSFEQKQPIFTTYIPSLSRSLARILFNSIDAGEFKREAVALIDRMVSQSTRLPDHPGDRTAGADAEVPSSPPSPFQGPISERNGDRDRVRSVLSRVMHRVAWAAVVPRMRMGEKARGRKQTSNDTTHPATIRLEPVVTHPTTPPRAFLHNSYQERLTTPSLLDGTEDEILAMSDDEDGSDEDEMLLEDDTGDREDYFVDEDWDERMFCWEDDEGGVF